MVTGWKTLTAAIGMALLGIVSIAEGNVENGVQQIVGGLALIGIGHKIEKAAK